MNDLVSLIVTSYNHAGFLDQRMESLLGQTYAPKEIIVIDDNSSDNSRSVLEKYWGRPEVVLVFNKRNGGGYANACNQGVALSRGPLVLIAQSDDFDEPTHVARLVEGLQAFPEAGVAFCRSAIVDEGGSALGNDFQFREPAFRALCGKDALIPGPKMAKFLLISCVIPNLSAALIRKSLYEKLNGLSTRHGAAADWDFWCRLSQECDFFYAAETLNSFRTHPATITSSCSASRQFREIIDVLYAARARTPLSSREDRVFKTNLGFIWANSILHHPLHWVSHAFDGLKLLKTHDPRLAVYIGFGFLLRLKNALLPFIPSLRLRGKGVRS